ncbi:MAG TPA: YifB family Mg chelatase-like AAA ATPase [Sphingobacteriaceae bacterium]|nr:YifB family Mg chelatase-like AAA ATPase [Sphingobacteriaceae bacterium]
MVTRLVSGALWGVEGYQVSVEVDVSRGLPAFDIVGLAGPPVREARERVRAGIKNAGYDFPLARITINLAPADLPKRGTGFDLAIALGILHQTGQIPGGRWQNLALLAELSLDGTLRPIRGLVPILHHLGRRGVPGVVMGMDEAGSAHLLPDLEIITLPNLEAVCRWIRQGCSPMPRPEPRPPQPDCNSPPDQSTDYQDLAHVEGHRHARRALEIAAAGGHNLLLIGPPGTGKSTLAQALPGILPSPTKEEALEIVTVYSAAGQEPPMTAGGSIRRPYRAPHHTMPPTAMVGGGAIPEPGEVSLAHRGVLFLDELAQFQRSTLEALREPLAEGWVTVARLQGSCRLPAVVSLVAAMNPCPCGHRGDADFPCRCTDLAVRRYWATLSGPMLDRLDIHVPLARPAWTDVFSQAPAESSAQVRSRVEEARQIQRHRLQRYGLQCNAEMGRQQLERYCRPDGEGRLLLQEAYRKKGLTMRGYYGALKVARTIADLEGCQEVTADHIAQALDLRRLDQIQGYYHLNERR